jgi:hypothetical protein
LKRLFAEEWWTTFRSDGRGALNKRRRGTGKRVSNSAHCRCALKALKIGYITVHGFYFLYDDVQESFKHI